MYKIAICDDERIIGRQIEGMILNYSERTRLEVEVTVFESGENLYKLVK